MSWVGLISTGVSAIGGLLGGGKNEGACPGQPDPSTLARALAAAPPARIAQLQARWAAANPNEPLPTHDPFRIGKLAWGGSDCKTSGSAGQALKADVQDLVATYGYVSAPTTGGTTTGGTAVQSGGWTGGVTAGGSQGGGWSLTVGAQQSPPGPLGLPLWTWALVVVGLVVVALGRGGSLRIGR